MNIRSRVTFAVLCTVCAACAPGRTQTTPSHEAGASVTPMYPMPSESLSWPCTGNGGQMRCGTDPAAVYTLTDARNALLPHSLMGTGILPGYRVVRPRVAAAAYLCAWETTPLHSTESEYRFAYRPWNIIPGYARTTLIQRVYQQSAVVYPDERAAQRDYARISGPCKQPHKDITDHIGGWEHFRRTQNMTCHSYGACSKVTDIVHKSNAVIVTTFSQTMGQVGSETITAADTRRIAEHLFGLLTKRLPE